MIKILNLRLMHYMNGIFESSDRLILLCLNSLYFRWFYFFQVLLGCGSYCSLLMLFLVSLHINVSYPIRGQSFTSITNLKRHKMLFQFLDKWIISWKNYSHFGSLLWYIKNSVDYTAEEIIVWFDIGIFMSKTCIRQFKKEWYLT